MPERQRHAKIANEMANRLQRSADVPRWNKSERQTIEEWAEDHEMTFAQAISATAGTAPVPPHIAYFGGAVALGGRAAVPYRAVRMAGVLMRRRQNPHDYRHAKT